MKKALLVMIPAMLALWKPSWAADPPPIQFSSYYFRELSTPRDWEFYRTGETVRFQLFSDFNYSRVSYSRPQGRIIIGGQERTVSCTPERSSGDGIYIACSHQVLASDRGQLCLGSPPFAPGEFTDRLTGVSLRTYRPHKSCVRYSLNSDYIPPREPDDHGDFRNPTTIFPNSRVTGNVSLGDEDCFSFTLSEAGTLEISVIGDIETSGWVTGPDVSEVWNEDYDGVSPRILATIPTFLEPRQYSACVRTSFYPGGSYTFHLAYSAGEGAPPDPPVVRGELRATLLNLSPWQAWVHLYCQKDQRPRADLTTDPCAVTLECGQIEGTPVTWTVDVEPKLVFSYKSGTEANLEAALVAAGKTEAEARRRTTCEVFSPDPLEVRAFTRIAGELVSVADEPILLDQAVPQRIATLIDLSPPQSWVHLYCRKDRPAPDAAPADPCAVNVECRQEEGDQVSWIVAVAPKTIFSYWPSKTAPDGTSDNLQAALMNEGKTEEEARRRTTCEVSSSDPVAVRGYTRLGEGIIPVKN